MIRTLIEWNRRRREWNAKHKATWHGLSDHGDDGLSPFQHQCEAALSSELARVGLSLLDRVVHTPPSNEYVTARIGGTPVSVWIHDDTAGFDAPGGGRRFEEWDYLTPDDLIAEFCRRAIHAARHS